MIEKSIDILRFYSAASGTSGLRLSLKTAPDTPTAALVRISCTEPLEIEATSAMNTFNLQLSRPVLVRRHGDGGNHERLCVPGQFSFVPAQAVARYVVYPASECVSLNVHFGRSDFKQFCETDGVPGDGGELPPILGLWSKRLQDAGVRLAETLIGPAAGRLEMDLRYHVLYAEISRAGLGARDSAPKPARLTAWALRSVIDYLHASLGEDVSLSELASLAGLSPFHFARSFKATVGLPPHRYLSEIRYFEARTLLARTAISITEIAMRLGYGTPSHFSTAFRNRSGATPSAFRQSFGNTGRDASQDFESGPSKPPL